MHETFLDEFVAAVDKSAETPRPAAVYVKMFVRQDGCAFEDFEMQLLVGVMILAEMFCYGGFVVQVIEIGHR